jgi:hypothetical protein
MEMVTSMSIGRKFEKGLDFVRISLGGAMVGALASNVFGPYAGTGSSMTRDLICAGFGFALIVYVLIDEDQSGGPAKPEVSEELDPAPLPVEDH